MSLNSPTNLPSGYGLLKQEDGGGGQKTVPDDRYSDYDNYGENRIIILQWQNDKTGKWSKEHEISLGAFGDTNLTRMMSPMGVYRSRQYRFILPTQCHVELIAIEEDSYIQGV